MSTYVPGFWSWYGFVWTSLTLIVASRYLIEGRVEDACMSRV